MKHCIFCGELIPGGIKKCPICAESFDFVAKECPYCQELIPIGAVTCPVCAEDVTHIEYKLEKPKQNIQENNSDEYAERTIAQCNGTENLEVSAKEENRILFEQKCNNHEESTFVETETNRTIKNTNDISAEKKPKHFSVEPIVSKENISNPKTKKSKKKHLAKTGLVVMLILLAGIGIYFMHPKISDLIMTSNTPCDSLSADTAMIKIDSASISTAWVVIDDYVSAEVLPTIMAADSDISGFSANTILQGEVRRGHLYVLDCYGNECYKVGLKGLKEIILTKDIPLSYGDGKAYKSGYDEMIKIEPLDISGKRILVPNENDWGGVIEIEKANDEFSKGIKKIIRENQLYLLYTYNRCDYNSEDYGNAYKTDWELYSLLEKTEYGFRSCPYCIWGDGVIDDKFIIGFVEDEFDRIRWVPEFNGLCFDIIDISEKMHIIENRKCITDAVSQSDYGNYDVKGPVKEIIMNDCVTSKIHFSKEGRLIPTKNDIIIRDKYGWLLETKIYNTEISSEYVSCYEIETWEYDISGNIASHQNGTNCADYIPSGIVYKYDADRNIKTEIVPIEGGTSCTTEGTDTITYKYISFDKYGNWTKRECRNKGKLYDDCNEYGESTDEGKTTWHDFIYEETCERVYDDYGNWVKMTIKRKATDNKKDNYYKPQAPDDWRSPKVETRTRTITYYQNDMGGYMVDPN